MPERGGLHRDQGNKLAADYLALAVIDEAGSGSVFKLYTFKTKPSKLRKQGQVLLLAAIKPAGDGKAQAGVWRQLRPYILQKPFKDEVYFGDCLRKDCRRRPFGEGATQIGFAGDVDGGWWVVDGGCWMVDGGEVPAVGGGIAGLEVVGCRL